MGAAAAGGAEDPRWALLAGRRSELVVRWQCLLQEREQLSAAMQSERHACMHGGA